jgi:multiple sugar transport system permease protein
MLKPTLFTVLTLGLIGTWQVFDQIYLTGRGAPAKTLLTPAFLAYDTSFSDLKWGQGAAISFILFGIIVALTLFQRWVLRDRDAGRAGQRRAVRAGTRLRKQAASAQAAGAAVPQADRADGGER